VRYLVYSAIIDSIAEGEAEETLELTQRALAQGYPAEYILEKGLISGMVKVAEKFKDRKVVVPEVLMAARAMHAGVSILEPVLRPEAKRNIGKVVLGTVAGDLHDIGLTLVKTMVMSTGAFVVDLGVDVKPKQFAAAVRKEKPDILMMSALLTTTMSVMKEVVDELKVQGLRESVKVIVGGAPVTSDFATEIGSDYFFQDAFEVRNYLKENLAKITMKKGT
jgi:5-methyltetrahydrofolate--homocysteine methyltransferase